MGKIKRFTVYDMAAVGVMAAIVFVLTYFIKIPIPTPAGPVMLKISNAFCLLAGVLFGGLRGGLASGIGSMLFDLLDPIYITDAPITLIRFFLMAFICGVICSNAARVGTGKLTLKRMIVATTCGSCFSFLFYAVQSVLKKTIETTGFTSLLFSQTGFEAMQAAFAACIPKFITSGINTIAAIVIACLLAPAMRKALQKVGFYSKSGISAV